MKKIKRFNESRITPPDIDWITDCFSEIVDRDIASVSFLKIPRSSSDFRSDKFVQVVIKKPITEDITIRQRGYQKDSEFSKLIANQKLWSKTLEEVDDALTKLNGMYPEYEIFFQTHRQSIVISIYAKEN